MAEQSNDKRNFSEINSMFSHLSAIMLLVISFIIQAIPNLDIASRILLFISSLVYIGALPWYVFYFLPYMFKDLAVDYRLALKNLGFHLLLASVAGTLLILLIIILVVPPIIVASLGLGIGIALINIEYPYNIVTYVIAYTVFAFLFTFKFLKPKITNITERLLDIQIRKSRKTLERLKSSMMLLLMQYFFSMAFPAFILILIPNKQKLYIEEFIKVVTTGNIYDNLIIVLDFIFFLTFVILFNVIAYLNGKYIYKEIRELSREQEFSKETNINPKTTKK